MREIVDRDWKPFIEDWETAKGIPKGLYLLYSFLYIMKY